MGSIVVADDDADIRALVTFRLRQSGHDVVAVADGAAAVAACRKSAPDLVVLDVTMPVLSGLEACRELRADPALARVPVLLLTARTQEHDLEHGAEVGADDYLAKPFSPTELVERVEAMLGDDG